MNASRRARTPRSGIRRPERAGAREAGASEVGPEGERAEGAGDPKGIPPSPPFSILAESFSRSPSFSRQNDPHVQFVRSGRFAVGASVCGKNPVAKIENGARFDLSLATTLLDIFPSPSF